jgi:hypothetical protein
MEETLKYGISISNLLLSEPNSTTNHGILRDQESQMICKSGAQTQDGGNCSSIQDLNL